MVALGHSTQVEHWTAVGRSLRLGPDDTVLVATPLFHSSGIRNAALVMWTAGGCVALQDGFSARGFWDQAAVAGATWSCLVETMLSLLVAHADPSRTQPQTMRFVVAGGPPHEELDGQQGLAAPGRAADQGGPAPGQAAPGDLVQPLDAGGALG